MSRLGLGMKEEGILSSTRLGEWRAGGETCQNLDRFTVQGGIVCCGGNLTRHSSK